MAKIHTLKISNYRSLQNFEQNFGMSDFICLIGRGDSGKSTILEAISIVLSPNWNLTIYDTDFFNGDISKSIEIEASLYDLPQQLLRESKFGLYKRFLNKKGEIIDDVLDEELNDEIEVLTVKFLVNKDLEPKWFVVNNREKQQEIEISAKDRSAFNAFLVSDYIDRHFSWNKGNPLYSLLKVEDTTSEKSNVIIDAFRVAKEKIDSTPFEHLDKVVEKIKLAAFGLGVDIADTNTTIDFRDISIKDGRICLHESKVPFRQKGKGSKRLISIAIQTELANSGGILLIDEIEQGLEPDRAQHLAKTLKIQRKGQVFITTHSRDVLVELNATDIFRANKGEARLYSFDSSLQACLRSNPEAFFSDRVLVCEGSTEVGICRGLNDFRISNGKANAALLGVRFADGKGATQIEYSKAFKKAGYDVCLFCDSDVTDVNEAKTELISLGIKIVDCNSGKSIENHLFEDLPWAAIVELLEYRINEKDEQSVTDSVRSKYAGSLPNDWKQNDNQLVRGAIQKASVSKSKEWFKRTDHGEFVGKVICRHLKDIPHTKLGTIISELSDWIDNA